MAVEAPIRNLTFSFSGRERSAEAGKSQSRRMGIMEYGPVAGRPESSAGYWIPVDWIAWKLLVDVLGIPPEKVK